MIGPCPRCGAMRDDEAYCPYCGDGLPPDPVFLLGGPVGDGVAATLAGLIPGLLLLANSLAGGIWQWTYVVAPALLVLELLAFFTFLRLCRTLRRAFALVCLVYSLPAALLGGCAGLVAIVTGDGAFGLLALLCVVAVLLLQGVVWFFAFQRQW